MIVADTNLIVYLLVPGEFTQEAESLFRKDSDWVAPASWRIEFLNVLSTYCRRGLMALDKAIAAMEYAVTVVRDVPVEPVAAEVLALSMAHDTAAYDCVFILAARMNSLPLVTFDRALLTKFPDCAMRPGNVLAWFERRIPGAGSEA